MFIVPELEDAQVQDISPTMVRESIRPDTVKLTNSYLEFE